MVLEEKKFFGKCEYLIFQIFTKKYYSKLLQSHAILLVQCKHDIDRYDKQSL